MNSLPTQNGDGVKQMAKAAHASLATSPDILNTGGGCYYNNLCTEGHSERRVRLSYSFQENVKRNCRQTHAESRLRSDSHH